jgi:Tol biopolymer transport system component
MWAVVTGLLSIVAAVVGWNLRDVPSPAEMRLSIETPSAMDPTSLAISPDARNVVFEAISEGRPRLWVRSLNSATARPLARTEEAYLPFWSPDSRSVGFFAAGKLKRIDLEGGTVQTLADATVGGGGTWNRDGVIVFVPNRIAGFSRVSASGGQPAEVLDFGAKQGLRQLSNPEFLPDGAHFVFASEGRGGGIVELYVGALDGSEPRHLFDTDNGDTATAYAAGHLFFIRQGTLFAQRFDLTRLAPSGDPIPVTEAVGVVAAATVSTTATVIYRPASGAPRQRQLVWMDRSGNMIGALGDPYAAGAGNPSMSPDGTMVALAQVTQGNSDLWTLDTMRGLFTRFTSDAFISNTPVWSPDGSRIIFQSNPKGVLDLYEQRIAGDRSEQLVLATPEGKMATDWRGDFVLYHTFAETTGADLWALPMKGDRKPFVVVKTAFDERIGQFSPDGKWVAYQSNESGQDEIYVTAFPPSPGRSTRVSTSGGAQVRWREDGKELFYIALDDRLMAVPMRFDAAGSNVQPGVPVALFTTHVGGALQQFMTAPTRQQYMVSRDGSRFLMNNLVEQPSTTFPITVLLNWKGKS